MAVAATAKCTQHLQLIDAVREHEVLYNSELKEYNDNLLKMRLWRLIASKCDIPSGDDAKKIWKNLRDGFRCSIKTLKLYENKEPPRLLKPWKYVEEMEFLRPFMKDRIFTNAAYYEEDSSDPLLQGGGSCCSGSSLNSTEETIECRPDIGLLANPPSLLSFFQLHSQDNSDIIPLEMVKQEQTMTVDTSASLVAASGAYGQRPAPRKQTRKNRGLRDIETEETGDGMESSLKLFFDSMYQATRVLPPALQRVVRIKLFQTVTDAEMTAESAVNQAALVYNQQINLQHNDDV